MEVNEKLVDSFIKCVDWSCICDSKTFSEEAEYEVINCLNYMDFDYNSGVTKLVILPKDEKENFVIKVPFSNYYDEDVYNEDYDPEDEDSSEYGDYIRMEGAPFGCGFDYCQSELIFLDFAREAGVTEFFPETECYISTPYPVYVQEKCAVVYKSKSSISRTKEEETEKTNSLRAAASVEQKFWINHFHVDWLLDIVDLYGEEKLFKLFQFLDDQHINDLHRYNYGYAMKDHRPVIIDFAGFDS